jgi:flagellar biosynthesis protein FlhG
MVITTTAGPEALTGTYAWLKQLAHARRGTSLRVAVCRTRSEEEARLAYGNLAAVARRHLDLGLEYLGSFGYDRAVLQATRAYRPVLDAFPSSGAARQLRTLAMRFETRGARSTTGAPANESRSTHV